MGRSQISNIVKATGRHLYINGISDLVAPNPYLKCMPKIHVCYFSTFQGCGYPPYNVGASQNQHRSSLRFQFPYRNNYIYRYTTSSNSKRSRPENSSRILKNGHMRSEWAFRPGIISSAILVLISAGLLLHYNDERRAIPKASEGYSRKTENIVSKPSIGGPFKLINYNGKPVAYDELRGKWTLIYFGYTSSPDIDPEEVQKIHRVIEILESKEHMEINAVFITIDPLRDTPSQLCAYLQEFDPRIIGLTGPENAVRQAAQEYRVYFKKTDVEGSDYLIDCSHNMYLMNPNMEFVRTFGVEYIAEQLADAIVSEVRKMPESLQTFCLQEK